MLHAVGDSPAPRRSDRAAASATASPVAAAAAVAAPIAHASAAPPTSSDAAAPLAKPKPGGTGKKLAKGLSDGAENTASKQYPLPTATARSTRAAASAAAATAAPPPHPLIQMRPLVPHRLNLSLAAQGRRQPGTPYPQQGTHRRSHRQRRRFVP